LGPDVVVQRLGGMRRFGVTATERKFGETLARPGWIQQSCNLRVKGANFFIPNARNPLKSLIPKK
jgi:hypothetical protein